ncbi:autotransporter outer membrane beta-barrel domain-containing protein [Bartonella sp. LJL80]
MDIEKPKALHITVDAQTRLDVRNKSACNVLAIMSLTLLLSTSMSFYAHAASSCNMGANWTGGTAATGNNCTVSNDTFNPQTSDHYAGAALVSGSGENLTITGDLSGIKIGNSGITGIDKLSTYDPSAQGQTKLDIGSANGVINVVDSGGVALTVNVYTNSSFQVSDWGDSSVIVTQAVNSDQYIQSGFGKAENGGHLTVALDDYKGNYAGGAPQTTYLTLKDSNLTWADGVGSVVEWQSRNSFESRAYAITPQTIQNEISVPVFPHSFTDYRGQTRILQTTQDLIAYNSELVDALQDPQYTALKSQAAYDAAFAAAQPTEQKIPVTGPGYDIPADDDIFQANGDTRAMYASNGGKIVVKSGGELEVLFDSGEKTGAMVAEGANSIAEIEAGGIVSARGNSTVILVQDSIGTNNGVINAAYRKTYAEDTTIDSTEFAYGSGVEAYYGGNITNNGIINVAANRTPDINFAYSNGMYLRLVGFGTNNGIINVGVNNDGLNGRYIGVAISYQYSQFTNNSDGTIYIGRSAQYDSSNPEATVDTSNRNNAEFYGIMASENASAINNGSIIIGTKMQNAIAMAAIDDSALLNVVNNGTISINGDVATALGQETDGARNYGLLAINNGNVNTVANNGTISLNGRNGIGVYVASLDVDGANRSAKVTLTEDSVINVAGATQGDTLLRNYGVWVEGRQDDSHYAYADIDGKISLSGDGAIGVYVSNGGFANVNAGATPQFIGGERQIGFYIYGAESKIVNATKLMDVSTTDSVLFRLDGGATFEGNGEQLSATAQGSVILEGAGRLADGTQTNILTKDARLTVAGADAIGVYINGGAFGQISDNSVEREIYLQGNGAVGGVVDGRYHKLDTSYASGEDSTTKLVNYAKIDSNAENVTGFITRNSGLLINQGSISLSNGINATGIHVIEGGRLENNADIIVSNGIGLHVEGVAGRDTAANIINKSRITVEDGTAGIFLENNAFLNASGSQGEISVNGSAHGVLMGADAKGIVLGVDHITVGAGGTGNGVENNMTSSDPNYAAFIAFKDTTIDVLGSGSGIRTAVGLVTQYTDENNVTQNSKVTINVGSAGVGYDFRSAALSDPVLGSNTVVGSGYTINVSDSATGLRTNTSGEVVNVSTIRMDETATGIGWLAGTASRAHNAGTIESRSGNALLVDLSNRALTASKGITFINSGSILANSSNTLAIQGSDLGDTYLFTNADMHVRGLLQAGDGRDQLTWSGGSWDGGFDLGGGDGDQALITGALDTTKFSHALAGSGKNNTLTIANTQMRGGSFSADDISRGTNIGNNWRTIRFQSGTEFTLVDDMVGTNGLNVDLQAGSTLVINQSFYGGSNDHQTISSTNGQTTFINSGLIDLSRSGRNGYDDRLTVIGDYHGQGGSIRMNTQLGGDGSSSDRLIIDGGTVTGTTTLYIEDLIPGTTSAITNKDGIKLIDAINGATTNQGNFTIGSGWGRGYQRGDGVMAVAGSDTAYAYLLYRGTAKNSSGKDVYGDSDNASDWYLRSGEYVVDGGGGSDGGGSTNGGHDGGDGSVNKPSYGPSTPLYEAYPQVLMSLNRLSTLQQRVGNRFWADGVSDSSNAGQSPSEQASKFIEHRGFWGRMEGSTGKASPDKSTTQQNYDLDLWRMQAGLDGVLSESMRGSLIGSFMFHYGRAEADIHSDDGRGKVESSGYGFGFAATWYGFDGSYMDLQSQATWFETDFNSHSYTLSDVDGKQGFGYGFSIEAGHQYDLTGAWAIIPQVQLSYSTVDFDSFRDGLNTKVSLKNGDSLESRTGIAVSKNSAWRTTAGDDRRMSLYGVVNLYYEFLDGTEVEVSRTSFRNTNDDFQAGLSLGGSYNWQADKWSLYGEANVKSAFDNPDSNYSLNGTLGLRARF